MRHLRQEVPVRRGADHKPAEKPREGDDASIRPEQLQASSAADAEARSGVGVSRHERDREVHRAEDFEREAQAEPREVHRAAGLARDLELLSRFRDPKLPHAHLRRRHQGAHQTAVRGPHPESGERAGHGVPREARRTRDDRLPRPRARPRKRLGPRGQGVVGRGAAALRDRDRRRARRGLLHVRRAVVVPGREAASEGVPGDSVADRDRKVHHRRRARPLRARLPLRLHLLPLRQARRVRRGDDALRRQGGHQHLPRRVRSHREPPLPRRRAHV
mmetsp:Transcript_118432/g.287402  ORF Transcript_118432/g.287402 Transcript_118432/m.287402 type:complete len:275 (-) Transcript_118432:900-1724(-)